MEVALGLFAVLLLIALIAWTRTRRALQKQASEQTAALAEHRDWRRKVSDYARNARLIDYREFDVVLFGPRASGKTSLVELWTSPWTQIGQLVPTAEWRTYEVDVHVMEEEVKRDELFEVDRIHIPTVRALIQDYPGEDSYRRRAVDALATTSSGAVVVLVLQVDWDGVGIGGAKQNAEYYSLGFVQELSSRLEQVVGSVERAIVVFNKFDLLPYDWDWTVAMSALKEANAEALHQIERVFAPKVEYCLTSAKTNQGVVRLLGMVGMAGIGPSAPENERERFDQMIEAARSEFGDQLSPSPEYELTSTVSK